MTYVSDIPKLDGSRKRHGDYDQAILNEARPIMQENKKLNIHDGDIHSEEVRNELWGLWDN